VNIKDDSLKTAALCKVISKSQVRIRRASLHILGRTLLMWREQRSHETCTRVC